MNYSNTSVESTENFRYVGIMIGFLDILLGTVGNLFTIIAVIHNQVLRKQPFNMFIVNLSVIDLLTAAIMMPFNVTGYILMDWPYGETACIFQAFFYFSCGYTSIVCLIAITLNRFVGITFPNRYRWMSKTILRLSICMCWLIAPAVLLPSLIVSLQQNSSNQTAHLTGWNSKQYLCTFVSVQGGWREYTYLLRGLFQVFPAFVMIFCYSIMFYKIRKCHKRSRDISVRRGYGEYKERMLNKEQSRNYKPENQKNANSCLSEDSISGDATKKSVQKISLFRNSMPRATWRTNYEINNGKIVVIRVPVRHRSQSHQCRRDREIHLLYVSIIVSAVFTILFLPSFVINLIPGSRNFDPRIHMAASNITWLNSCVNPLVYAFLHKGMQHEYRKLLSRCVSKIRELFSFSKN